MKKSFRSACVWGVLVLLAVTASRVQAAEQSEQTVPREFEAFAEVPQHRGVIDDPDGYVNVRKEQRADAPVVAKVKTDEPFSFERKEKDQWCKVKLSSGATGWMHYSRIRLFFTKDNLPGKPEEGDEIDEQARKHGVNYYEVTQAAARGDKAALKKFFDVGEFADGAAAEEHWGVITVVIHLVGDEALAKFLRGQSKNFREGVRTALSGDVTFPFGNPEYFRQHFPRTAKILFSAR